MGIETAQPAAHHRQPPETGEPITASIGRYGPYLAHSGKYARLTSTTDVFETGMNAAVVKLAEAAAGGGRAARGTASREPLKVLGKHPRTEAEIKLMEGATAPTSRTARRMRPSPRRSTRIS